MQHSHLPSPPTVSLDIPLHLCPESEMMPSGNGFKHPSSHKALTHSRCEFTHRDWLHSSRASISSSMQKSLYRACTQEKVNRFLSTILYLHTKCTRNCANLSEFTILFIGKHQVYLGISCFFYNINMNTVYRNLYAKFNGTIYHNR